MSTFRDTADIRPCLVQDSLHQVIHKHPAHEIYLLVLYVVGELMHPPLIDERRKAYAGPQKMVDDVERFHKAVAMEGVEEAVVSTHEEGLVNYIDAWEEWTKGLTSVVDQSG